MKSLKTWMKNATQTDILALAKRAKTSRGMLYQLASGHRKASSELAGRIETASKTLPGRQLTRVELCDACRKCPYPKLR